MQLKIKLNTDQIGFQEAPEVHDPADSLEVAKLPGSQQARCFRGLQKVQTSAKITKTSKACPEARKPGAHPSMQSPNYRGERGIDDDPWTLGRRPTNSPPRMLMC